MSVFDVRFGTTDDLTVLAANTRGGTVTVSSATVTIKEASAGTVIRSAVACTVDSPRAYYKETFSAANGYVEGSSYIATFRVTMSDGWIPAFEQRFTVLAVNDQ